MVKHDQSFILSIQRSLLNDIIVMLPRENEGQNFLQYDLTRVAYEALLLEAEDYFSTEVFTEIFNDPKVWECLSPMICALLGKHYYYDPYKAKCVQHQFLNRILYTPKPTFPEFTAACEKTDMPFLQYISRFQNSSTLTT